MPIPNDLSGWAYEVVRELTQLGQVETDTHDFKYGLPPIDSLTKVCCSFANMKGGFIVLGVKDYSGHFAVEGITPDGEIANKFGQRLKADPTIYFEPPKLVQIPNSAQVLYVFHIPRSEHRPHLPTEPSQRFFWKRTNTGCERMTLEEIRNAFMNYEERREKLKLLFVELLMNKENIEEMSAVSEGTYSLIELDSSVLDRLLVDLYSIMQSNPRLIQLLLILRTSIRVTNNEIRQFLSKMTLSYSQETKLAMAKEHNQFIGIQANKIVPLVEEALAILETQYQLTNPLG